MLRFSLDFAIRALLIAAATAAVLRILDVRTPSARHTAWTGVLAAMLLLPAWTAWGPRIPLPLLPPLSSPAAYAAGASLDPAPLPLASPLRATWNWTTALVVIYLAGATLLLIRLIAGALQARSLVRHAQIRDGHLFSASCATPVTLGWFRPVVLLPANAEQWSSAQLDAVLTHEREHARRRDPLVQLLALLNRTLFWFHPLAWWLEHQLAALAEEACDAAVLARGHDPHDYSQHLISLARPSQPTAFASAFLEPPCPGTASIVASPSSSTAPRCPASPAPASPPSQPHVSLPPPRWHPPQSVTGRARQPLRCNSRKILSHPTSRSNR